MSLSFTAGVREVAPATLSVAASILLMLPWQAHADNVADNSADAPPSAS